MQQSRFLGGYAVIPLPRLLRRTFCAEDRAVEIAEALAAVRKLEAALLALKVSTAVDMHDRQGLPWKVVAARFRTKETLLHRLVMTYRRRAAVTARPDPVVVRRAA